MLVLLTDVFVGVLMLIWSIIMLEYISKIPADNGFNHLMVCIHVYVCCLYSFKYFLHFVAEIQTFHIIAQSKSCIVGDASDLIVT